MNETLCEERRLGAVDLSTVHIPQQLANFAGLIPERFRLLPYPYGTVAVLCGRDRDDKDDRETLMQEGFLEESARWISEFHAWCVAHDIAVAVFDCDGEELEGLPTYKW